MATLSRWSTFDYLSSEEKIVEYLEGTRQDIEDGDYEPNYFFMALATATKARLINHLAKETTIDRETIYRLVEQPDEIKGFSAPPEVITRMANAYAKPILV
jgi:probable addiction module antidote protein